MKDFLTITALGAKMDLIIRLILEKYSSGSIINNECNRLPTERKGNIFEFVEEKKGETEIPV